MHTHTLHVHTHTVMSCIASSQLLQAFVLPYIMPLNWIKIPTYPKLQAHSLEHCIHLPWVRVFSSTLKCFWAVGTECLYRSTSPKMALLCFLLL